MSLACPVIVGVNMPPKRTYVRFGGGLLAPAVATILEQISLGPSWPMAGTLDVVVGDSANGSHVAIALTTSVRERSTGAPIDITFRSTIESGLGMDYTVRRFADLLKEFLAHEVDEAVHVQGRLYADPHKVVFR